jgi:hypothetical protein
MSQPGKVTRGRADHARPQRTLRQAVRHNQADLVPGLRLLPHRVVADRDDGILKPGGRPDPGCEHCHSRHPNRRQRSTAAPRRERR